MDFQFHISGDEAAQIAGELTTAMQQNLAVQPKQFKAATAKDPQQKFDPNLAIAATTLVLAIPATVLTCLNLADRINKKKQTENLLSEIREIVKNKPAVKIRVQFPDGTLVAIETTEATKMIEAANEKQD